MYRKKISCMIWAKTRELYSFVREKFHKLSFATCTIHKVLEIFLPIRRDF